MFEKWLPENKEEIAEYQRIRAEWEKLQMDPRSLQQSVRLKKIIRWLIILNIVVYLLVFILFFN